MLEAVFAVAVMYAGSYFVSYSPNFNHMAVNGTPCLSMYQKAMVKERKHSSNPTTKYAWNMSLVSTRRSFLGLRGGRVKTSLSGFSYARVMAPAQSVKQQMMIYQGVGNNQNKSAGDLESKRTMRKDERI